MSGNEKLNQQEKIKWGMIFGGFDHGFSFLKTALDGHASITYPSYTVKDGNLSLNRMIQVPTSEKNVLADESENEFQFLLKNAAKFRYGNDKEQWIWGPLEALKNAEKYQNTYQLDGIRYPDPEYIRHSLFGVARSIRHNVKNNYIEVRMVTGVPPAESRDELTSAEYSDIENLLIESLENGGNAHKIEIEERDKNGKWSKRTLHIKVKVINVIPQSFGGLMDIAMDEKGSESENAGILYDSVIVIDIGGGTWIYSAIRDGVIVKKDSKMAGMRSAYNKIIEKMKEHDKQLFNEVKIEVVEQQIRAYIDNREDKKSKYHTYGFYISDEISIERDVWDDILHSVFSQHAKEIKSEVQSQLKLKEWNKILLTGGGAELLYPYFEEDEEWSKKLHKLDNPQEANIRGYSKLAKSYKRQWQEMIKKKKAAAASKGKE